jgi:acyl dehydratase
MPPLTVPTPKDLLDHVGASLGPSDWLEVPQGTIDQFAEATHDHQWIHVDPERAAQGPFGTTIAHGYLTLSLLVPLVGQLFDVERRSMGVNYGLNKVRFPAPVPAGSRVRVSGSVASVEPITGGVQVVLDLVMEREGGDKPVLVAQPVYRWYD